MASLKTTNSRKLLRRLSVRQRNRIMSEVRDNLRLQNSKLNIIDKQIRNGQGISGPSNPESDNSININLANDICHNVNVENESFSSFSSLSDTDDTSSSFFDTTFTELSPFHERLASCFIDNNLTHIQCNNILSLLRTHPCFHTLPKDIRTLLNTPRNRAVIFTVEPGEYIHFNMEAKIIQYLMSVPSAIIPNQLEIDINTDGCTLDKSGNINLWPIQIRIANIQHARPIVIGIYKGTQKPYDPNKFFEKFIEDFRKLTLNGGVNFQDNKIPVCLRCFIADAPARAFVLNHRGHTSSQPCSKCKVSGIRCEGRYVFNSIGHSLRTDEEYITRLDEDHHKEGISPLSMLPIKMVSQVPFEYMHLVCLGVMKKLLSAWVHGKYSRLSKLTGRSISVISEKLNTLKEYCPSDFARRPRSLDACSKYKATEFRQFLLYTGPAVTHDILDKQVYKHFLFLHAAIRVLVSKSPSRLQLNFAKLALQKFVERCERLYGPHFNTYNVHGLLHLTDDVKLLGSLDFFSAFPYENNMSIFKKYCRKPGLPLQQFFNRMAERDTHGTNANYSIDSSIRVSVRHSTVDSQYRKITFNGILLGIDTRDNCCLLRDGSVCIVLDIIMESNSYFLVVKKFVDTDDFYDIGILSSALQIYTCFTLSNDIFYVRLEEVCAKCYRMPLWDSASTNDSNSDEENYPEASRYLIVAITHSEKL